MVELIQTLKRIPASALIGIDGLGASGKTTLARRIAQALGDAVIIHTDDYYKPVDERTVGLVPEIVSPDFDWDALEREIFKKERKGITIIVGVYALQERFIGYYDFKIWVDAPHDVRVKRMIEREGEAVAREWQANWLEREERYLAVDRPDMRADVVMSV